MAISYNKVDNINIRINKEDKKALEAAAKANSLSLTAYIVSTCMKQAKIDLSKDEVLYLDKEQSDFVMKLLDNPPKPSKALIDLFK